MGRMKWVTPYLKTLDLEKTIAFYTEMLGFTVDATWPAEKPTLCFLAKDNVEMGFYVDTEQREGTPGLTGQMRIEVDDVMSLHRKVIGRADIVWGPEVYFYGRREFCFKDVNGYEIVFSELTDDPPTCPEE